MHLFKVFWISFAASAMLAWPIYRWLKSTVKQKIDPYAPESHQAKQGTPTMGGLIILVGALAGMYAIGNLSLGLLSDPGADRMQFKGVLGAALIALVGFGLIGFVDDFVVPRITAKRGLGWKQKIALEIIVALAAAQAIVQPIWSAYVLCGFLVLFFSNAFNFTDGLDGLAGSVWLAITVGFYMLSPSEAGLIGLAISGGVVVFLFLNAPPAKVFMGDVGSLPLGAVLGVLVYAFLCPPGVAGLYIHPPRILPVLILSLLMVAELVPVPMQVAYFKLTKGKRLFPMTPIHHAFEKKGWPESRVVWTFALFQLLLSLAAVTVYLLQSRYVE